MSDSLTWLFTKEWLWAFHSCHSLQKSDVSDSLSLLFRKERCEWFARDLSGLLAKNERFTQKMCILCMFLTVFPLFMPQSESLLSLFTHFLFFKERLERFSPVSFYKRVTMSDSLWLLMKKERQWAIHSGRSCQKSNGSESLFCSQKTSESLEKPMSEFPTLICLLTPSSLTAGYRALSKELPPTIDRAAW